MNHYLKQYALRFIGMWLLACLVFQALSYFFGMKWVGSDMGAIIIGLSLANRYVLERYKREYTTIADLKLFLKKIKRQTTLIVSVIVAIPSIILYFIGTEFAKLPFVFLLIGIGIGVAIIYLVQLFEYRQKRFLKLNIS